MTCPNCSMPTPPCPVCGKPMLRCDSQMPPLMSGRVRIIDHRWICSQSDGAGTRHIVDLHFPHKEN